MSDAAIAIGAATSSASADPVARVDELTRDDVAWDRFVTESPTPSHLQVTDWARVKAGTWSSFRVVADGGSGPIGAQVLVRRLGPGPFAFGYAPRGPIATTWDAPSLEAFSAALRRAARRRRLTHVTVDPAIEAGNGEDVLGRLGWRLTDPVQPDKTFLIDLRVGEEQLMKNLRQTTRWSVRKATREGITVRSGGEELFGWWWDLLAQTAHRSGFTARDVEAYRTTMRAFAEGGRSWIVTAHHPDGRPGAATMLFRCGGTVTEMYTGMSLDGAKALANFVLHWEAIRRAAEAGATDYDMWGIAHAGIRVFKAGFGGREVHYIGAWDLPTLPLLRDGFVRARRARGWVARQRRSAGRWVAARRGRSVA